MPPKRKKVGRPPGSKTKKTRSAKHGKKETKKLVISDIVIKSAFSCKECKKKFRFEESYKAHLQNEHSKTPGSITCDLCPVSCPDKETLMKHIDNYHERERYICPHCNKEFTRRSHVIRHMSQRGCGAKIAIHMCEICDATFTRKDNLMVHLRLVHIAREEFTCKHCMYFTKNFSKLINHVLKNHSEKPLKYECDHCGRVTGSRAAITKHLEIHGEKKFRCDVCGYASFTLEVLRRHILTHVQEKPHKCFICGRSYIQRIQLNRHMEKHTGHLCLECGKAFPSKAGLLIHVRDHKGLQKLFCPFEHCSYSKKEFVNSTSLQNHVETHLKEKRYECEVCMKRFHSETYMRKHVLTHTLERPRRCMYCVAARAYVRGEQLLRHVRQHHPTVFRDHLTHVRQVLGLNAGTERVLKSELEAILNVLDAESERILEGYGTGVLYGGMMEQDESVSDETAVVLKNESNPLMSEEELADSLKKLLEQLIDKKTLDVFGWPDETVDTMLEKVIEHCGARAADRDKWTRVQRLRENAKHLFVYVIEDKNITRMLDTHTIDQIIKHILEQVASDGNGST
ncbi:unnamed protein product [Parnassius mnemosyne]|uniref:C2H2-type domain-containing protein n=1 Tax=Parnassius mnemosyne TaxID=213953 RepID=A0AAV1KNI6_9NEOP